MYKFRFEDVHIGTVVVQFNNLPTDDIWCICNRVVIENKHANVKLSFHEAGNAVIDGSDDVDYLLLKFKSIFYQEYSFEIICGGNDTFSDEVENTSCNRMISNTDQRLESTATEKFDCSDDTETNKNCFFAKFSYFCRIFRILRRRFQQRRIINMFVRKRHFSFKEEDDGCSNILNFGPLVIAGKENDRTCIDKKMTESKFQSVIDDRAAAVVEEIDLVENGFRKMGYVFNAHKSESKVPYQRVSLHYNETQLCKMNENLILFKTCSDDALQNVVSQGQKTSGSSRKRRLEKSKKCNNTDESWPQEIEMNPDLRKYWFNRYRLFSKFDQGIQLDAESWYSVTPEKISRHLADRCCCDLIVDGFCGAGGNTIQFAFTCERVIAIDIDPKKIQLAKHNATIYKVADRIEFIIGDFFKIAPSLKADVVFLSPPWGGPNYLGEEMMSLQNIMEPYGGRSLFQTSKLISEHIAFYLPRNTNVDEVIKLNGHGSKVEIEQNILGKKIVAITAYFGELVYNDDLLE